MIRAAFTAISVPCFAQPGYYITSVCFCQGVFQNFFKFFRLFSSLFLELFFRADVMHIISHSVHFVKYLFKSFSTFFVISCALSLSRSPARGQLAYYSTSPSFCQPFFDKFFHFGASGKHAQISGKLLVQLAHISVIQSFKPAQNPFSPAVFPWGSKQWKATTRLRFRSAQTPWPYIPPPAMTPSVMRQIP